MKSKIKLLTILTTLLTYLSNPHRNICECNSETSRTKFRKVRHKTTKGERRFMIAPVKNRIDKLDLDDGKGGVAKKLNLVACHGSKCRIININSARQFPTVTINSSRVKKELGTNFPKWIMLLYNTDAQNFVEVKKTESKSSGPTVEMVETQNRATVLNTSSRNPRENITLVIQSPQNTKKEYKNDSRKSIKAPYSFLENKENVSSNLYLNSSIASKGGKNITELNEEKLNEAGNKTENSNSTKAIEQESGYIPKINLNNKKFEKQMEHCIHKTNRHQEHKKQAKESEPLQENRRNHTNSNLNITHRNQNSTRVLKIRLNYTDILLANKTDNRRKNIKNDVTNVNSTDDDREYIIPFIQKETSIKNDKIHDSKQTDNANIANEDLLEKNFENQNYFEAKINQQILKGETDTARENRQLSNDTIEGITPDSVFIESRSLLPHSNSTESIETDLHFPESVLTNNAEGEVSDMINENVVNIIKNLTGEDYIPEENNIDTDSSQQNYDFLNKNPSPEDSIQEDKKAPDIIIQPEQSISIKPSGTESRTADLLHKNLSPEERVAQGNDPTAADIGSEENVLINPSGGAMTEKTNSTNTDPEEVLTNEQLMNAPEIENEPDRKNKNESDVHLPEMVLTNVKTPFKPLRITQKSGHQTPQNLNQINGTSDQEIEKQSFTPENVLTNFPVNELKSNPDITIPTMEEETHTPTVTAVGKITKTADRGSSIDETISRVQNIHANEDFQNSNENKVQFAETVLTNSPEGVVIQPTKKKEQVLVNDYNNESSLHADSGSFSNKEAFKIDGGIINEAAKLEEQFSTAQSIYPAYDVFVNETEHKDLHKETAQASQTNGEAVQTKENAATEDDSQATFYHEEPEMALEQAGRSTNKNQEITPNAKDAFAKSDEMSLTTEKSQNQNNTPNHHFELVTGTSLLEEQQLQQQQEKQKQTLQEQNNIAGYENHTAGNAIEIINNLSTNTATNNDLNSPNSLLSHHLNNTENKLVPQEEEKVFEETEVVLPNSHFGKPMNNSAANNTEGVNEEFEYHDQNEEMSDVLSKFRENFLYNFTQLEHCIGNNCSSDAINEQKLKNITTSNTLKVMPNPENVLTNPTVKPLSFLESLPTHHQNPTETMKRKKVLLDLNIFKIRRNKTIKKLARNDKMEATKLFNKKGNTRQNGERDLNKTHSILNEVWLKNHSNLALAYPRNETSEIKFAVNSAQEPRKTYDKYEVNNNLKQTESNTKYNELKLIGQKKYKELENTPLSLEDNKDSEYKPTSHKCRYDFSQLVKRITQVLSKCKNKTLSKMRPNHREREANHYTDLIKNLKKKDTSESELVNKIITKNFSEKNPIYHETSVFLPAIKEKLKNKLMRLFYKQILKKVSEDVERAIMLEKDKENNISREFNLNQVVISEKLENKTAVKRDFEFKYKYNKRTPLMVSYNIPHRYKNVN